MLGAEVVLDLIRKIPEWWTACQFRPIIAPTCCCDLFGDIIHVANLAHIALRHPHKAPGHGRQMNTQFDSRCKNRHLFLNYDRDFTLKLDTSNF